MNGGVIVEANSSAQLKQELITEHYTISAKRSSHKDSMNRQLKFNTSAPPNPHHPAFPAPHTAPIIPQQSYPPYPPPHDGPRPAGPPPASFYGPPQTGPPPPPGFYPYPPPPGHMPPGGPITAGAGPVPGPSRRHSQPFTQGPPPLAMHPGHRHAQFPPQWDEASVGSSASSHKRKRSGSSQHEALTPRRGSGMAQHDEDPRGPPPRAAAAPQLLTPPSSGPPTTYAHTDDAPPQKQKRGVYVTTTREEGRKLGLVSSATGTEAKEGTPARGPPRTKATTTLSVNEAGKAALASSQVLQTELDMLEKRTTPSLPQTPNGAAGNPQTPTGKADDEAPDAKDTPGTKANKTTRRLSAFNLAARPSEPMYSIRLDMGQGQPCRVALRKDLALAFVGLDKTTQVVEESRARNEDEDGWATMNGAPGSRPPVRPDWPDQEAPWKIGSGTRQARQLREDKERTAMLKRYLETSSDDEDEDDGAARFPSHRGRAAHAPTPGHARRPSAARHGSTSDAKAALLSAMNRSRRNMRRSAPPVILPGGVVSCVCNNNSAAAGTLIPCTSCRSWSHLHCVGLENLQMAENWVCDPCVVQARRATLSSPSGRTPVATRYTHERSHSAFRGGDMALALAPSPMFAGDVGMVQATPMPMGARTPLSPSRSSRQRARVLSYGTDIWGSGGPEDSPTTPVPPPRIPDHFSTPRADDPVFDVNSTPSRHLNTDPRMAGQFNSLFAVTPLMGRSRGASGMLAQHDTPLPGRRNVSGGGPGQLPASDTGVLSRHEFLQGLTADRRVSATEGPASPAGRWGVNQHDPVSPSPYGSMSSSRANKFSNLRGGAAGSGARPHAGLGLGMPLGKHKRRESNGE